MAENKLIPSKYVWSRKSWTTVYLQYYRTVSRGTGRDGSRLPNQIVEAPFDRELRSRMQLLLTELQENPQLSKGRKRTLDLERVQGLLDSLADVDRLHRAAAMLLVKLKRADVSCHTGDVYTVLEQRTMEENYQHHQWHERESQTLGVTVCCRQCGRIQPREDMLQDLPCQGRVRVALRA